MNVTSVVFRRPYGGSRVQFPVDFSFDQLVDIVDALSPGPDWELFEVEVDDPDGPFLFES